MTAHRPPNPYDPTAGLGGGLRALGASAGTGKTFAITSTVLRAVVERGLRMDRLLLVTFTRAATAELEDRLRSRLVAGERALRRAEDDGGRDRSGDVVLDHVVAHARSRDPEQARRRVEDALRTVDQATVTTIHGFCHQVLQQAPVAADSDPAVALDTDDDRLVAAVVDDWIVELTDGEDEELVALLDEIGCTRTALQALGRTVAQEPDPVFAPGDVGAADLDPLAVVADACDDLERALVNADESVAAAQEAKDRGEITGSSTWSPTPAKLPKRIEVLRAELEQRGRPTSAALSFLDPAGRRGDGSKPMPVGIAATPVPRAVEGLLDALARVETSIRRRLADHVRTELVRRRSAAGTASFADLLRHLAEALDGDDGERLVAEVAADYDAVLVDEFQDTDPVQWSILRRLFADLDLFHVVGDPKQAIYGWRGADLRTYLRALDDAAEVSTMATNWRSDSGYVDAIDHLLGRTPELAADSLGGRGVRYVGVTARDRPEPRLVASDGTDGAGLRLRHLTGLAGRGSRSVVVDVVAEDVAQDVVDTINGGVRRRAADDEPERVTSGGPGPPRPLVPADCVVLVRRHTEATAVAEALRRRGVPVVVGGGDDVLRSDEADALADLLRVLVAPGDDRALRRLLVGPFVGLDGSELAELTDEDWQDHAVRARTWARTWADGGIAAAFQRAVREGGAEARHARVAGGDRTVTNLRHLAELLHVAEQGDALGTHALAAWFDARRAEAADERTPPERELRLERDDAAVRVMTVHAAKGLEFPCVWVPFLWTREGLGSDRGDPFVVNDPRRDDHPRTVSVHASSSPVMRARSDDRRALRTEHDLAEWEGGLRLAYVALTRAEHRCTVHLCAYDRQASLTSSPAWQLFWAPTLGDGRPTSDAGPPGYTEDELRMALRELAEHETIDLDEVASAPASTSLDRDGDGPPSPLEARRWTRREPLDRGWGRASFTGLLRGRSAPAPADAAAADEADRDETADRDAHGLSPLARSVCEAEPQVPLASLPRGAAWGTYLHDVLEHVDFDADLDAIHELASVRARWATARATDEHTRIVAIGLHAALATPLGPGLDDLRLRDVGRDDRLDELAFTLKLGDGRADAFDVAAVAELFERHAPVTGTPLARAAAHLRAGGTGRPVHGLLVGSIDLVFRHDGRFWIADYKSNGLGQWLASVGEDEGRWCETEAHTGPDRVMDAMVSGDYLLQAHLYVVALHRYLRDRLRDAYDYDRHVGGWAYLFLRGMTGSGVRRTDGRPHGIAVGRPSRALVDDLDALLGGGGAAP